MERERADDEFFFFHSVVDHVWIERDASNRKSNRFDGPTSVVRFEPAPVMPLPGHHAATS